MNNATRLGLRHLTIVLIGLAVFLATCGLAIEAVFRLWQHS